MWRYANLQSLDTASADRSSLRLHSWAIYLDQYRDHMRVVYSKGADLECPDALSRLRYEISSKAKHLRAWAAKLGVEPQMQEFEVQECFAVTRLGKAHAIKSLNSAGSKEALEIPASKNPSS